MTALRLTPVAASAIRVDVVDGQDDDFDPPSFTVLREVFLAGSGKRLDVPAEVDRRTALWDALNELSNAFDDRASVGEPRERRFARAAARQLGELASQVLRNKG